MGDSSSPLMLRRRLRNELRAARLDKGLTQEQVAQAMEWSLSKMNRIEKAKTGISANDLKALLPLYGVTAGDQTEELLALARASRQAPWWRGYADVAPSTLLELIDYESAASAVSQFEMTLVPRTLQTEEYAREVLQEFYGENSRSGRVGSLVGLYTRCRSLLTDENAPVFSFILDESILRRVVGNSDITCGQLFYLASVAKLPNVTIQIAPFAAGLHPGLKGSFEIMQFDDVPEESVVFIGNSRGDFIGDDPEETRSYLKIFSRIAERSLSPSDSVGLLCDAASAMNSPRVSEAKIMQDKELTDGLLSG